MTFGSLFAGIGGFDLGFERAGLECRWQVEIDSFCQKVLAKHWPDVKRYGDIKEVDWSEVERVDVACGGFPCQPVSSLGERRAQEDERWLWPEFARCLGRIRPRFAVVENVPGLLDVNGGSAFGEVLGDLASLGYDAEWQVLPAALFGASHLRERLWVVAYNREERFGLTTALGELGRERPRIHDDRALAEGGPLKAGGVRSIEPLLCRGVDAIPDRMDRVECCGNAVIPQIPEWIGRRLMEHASRPLREESQPGTCLSFSGKGETG